MEQYIMYHEFGRRKLTTKNNYERPIRNASMILDMSKFVSDESAKQYLTANWNLLDKQIEIIG